MTDWDQRYLSLAEEIAKWSKDPSTKVGAVIVDENNSIVSLGYNGFPRNAWDSDEILNDREAKLARTVHAELNAILNARRDTTGCRIYVSHPPCSHCAAAIIQSRIWTVIYRTPSADLLERWGESIAAADALLLECGITSFRLDHPSE